MKKETREITPTKRALAKIGSIPEFKTLEKIVDIINHNELTKIMRLNEFNPTEHSIYVARAKGGILALKRLIRQIKEARDLVDNE